MTPQELFGLGRSVYMNVYTLNGTDKAACSMRAHVTRLHADMAARGLQMKFGLKRVFVLRIRLKSRARTVPIKYIP